jgi:hypothetical protein
MLHLESLAGYETLFPLLYLPILYLTTSGPKNPGKFLPSRLFSRMDLQTQTSPNRTFGESARFHLITGLIGT